MHLTYLLIGKGRTLHGSCRKATIGEKTTNHFRKWHLQLGARGSHHRQESVPTEGIADVVMGHVLMRSERVKEIHTSLEEKYLKNWTGLAKPRFRGTTGNNILRA